MHQSIAFVEENVETVLWRCINCSTEVRFPKTGYGEPAADSVTPPLEEFNRSTSGFRVEGGPCVS